MLLTFLKAAVPLSKSLTYSARDDSFTTAHYPMVKRMTSDVVHVDTMLDFHDAIDTAGAEGKCLMFGQLKRELNDESRAELAVDGLHEWILFDFDKVDAAPTIEGALDAIKRFLPACCQDAECVIQLSPSCYNPRARKLSAHVFMRLNTPQPAARLKEFLVWCNFTNEGLRNQITLTESLMALSFALDRCVTDPSRLIYIAPPRMAGFTATIGGYTALRHYGGERGFNLPEFTAISRDQISDKINELREALGMERRDLRTIRLRGNDVLADTPEGLITDVKPSGAGFLRLNLNGGDSHAYWINLSAPDVIGNFKGEPFLSTKGIDKKFYEKLVAATKAAPAATRGSESSDILAFYATNRGSRVYIGTYDRANDVLRVDESSETPAYSWLQQFGMPVKMMLPHYDVTYDISSDTRYEEGYPVINLYARTDMIKQFGNVPKKTDTAGAYAAAQDKAPTITKVINSMCGDARSAEGFINWLAFIFQYRIKSQTAWLLWGTEGTGKGLFLENVVRPLFGETNVSQMLMANVDSSFNSMLEGKLIVNIDEAEMSKTRDKPEAMAKLRNWITEPTVVINTKNVKEHEVPSFANFIITANSFRPLMINVGDRRFHVGTRQDERFYPTANELAILKQGEELPAFAKVLGELEVDEAWVHAPELTEQKLRLFESTHSLADAVAVAIKSGDSSFFFEARPPAVLLNSSTASAMLPINEYDTLLRCMHEGTFNVLRAEDLYVLFSVVINDTKHFPDNPTKQKHLYNRYGLLDENKGRYCLRLKRTSYGSTAPKWEPVADHLLEVVDLTPRERHDNVTPLKTKK